MTVHDVVSLCSGVGLIDLGLEWAGWRTRQVCEIDPWCRSILQQRFPDAAVHDDVWTIQPVTAKGTPMNKITDEQFRQAIEDCQPCHHEWHKHNEPMPLREEVAEEASRIDMIAAGFPLDPASRSASPASGEGRLTTGGCGLPLHGAFASLDPDTSCWRTSQVSLLSDSETSSVTWPRSGSMRTGRCWEHGRSAPFTDVTGGGSSRLPTPTSRDYGTNLGGVFRPGWGTSAVAWAHGGDVADTDEERRGAGLRDRADVTPGTRHPLGTSSRPHMADAAGEREREPSDETLTVAARRDAWTLVGSGGRGITKPGLDRGVDGGTTRVDGPLLPAAWIDGTWEDGVPRVTARTDHRARRNSALGNGVVPQCVELIGLRIRQLDRRTPHDTGTA